MNRERLLTTENIGKMGLKEFMDYRHETKNSFSCRELQQANSDWLLVSELERVKNVAELRKLTKQMQEDLWRDIRQGGSNG
jgi:hypothetical protein